MRQEGGHGGMMPPVEYDDVRCRQFLIEVKKPVSEQDVNTALAADIYKLILLRIIQKQNLVLVPGIKLLLMGNDTRQCLTDPPTQVSGYMQYIYGVVAHQ